MSTSKIRHFFDPALWFEFDTNFNAEVELPCQHPHLYRTRHQSRSKHRSKNRQQLSNSIFVSNSVQIRPQYCDGKVANFECQQRVNDYVSTYLPFDCCVLFDCPMSVESF